jgi:hypothetical protein
MKSLIITILCAVSIMCFAAEVTYTGIPATDFKQYLTVNTGKVKTLSDIKTWLAEYKTACPTAKVQ